MERIVGLASDHAGFALKQHVIKYLDAHHIKYIDYGCYNEESCDYPDYAHKLAEMLAKTIARVASAFVAPAKASAWL